MPQPQALHACDNPSCVRPDHLSEGTNGQNLKEAYTRGRKTAPAVKGEEHGNTKLCECDVLEIRRRASLGEMQRSIGMAFGIKQAQVSRIILKQSWAHVE